MSNSTQMSTNSSCTIRPFEPDDRRALLSLYETVFGHERSTDWFRWKYEENPYVDHVPIIVAEAGGRLVGCRAFFAQEMRIGETVRLAFQPCDTMVHPAYQRQGLFSRMNEYALERYADGAPSFCFNFPNENSKQGNLNHGWKAIGTFPMYYRPQNPVGSVKQLSDGDGADGDTDRSSATARQGGPNTTRRDSAEGGHDIDPVPNDASSDDPNGSGVTNAIADVLSNSQQAGDRLVPGSTAGIDIVRFESPPAELLEETYRRAVPEGIHTNRTAAFYRWRFSNPAHEYTTYVATRDGENPVAALVFSRVGDHLRIVESLPRAPETATKAVNALLVSALANCADRNYVTAFGKTLPTPIRYRFYPDTRFPLSTLIKPTARTLLARDLGDETGIEDTTDSDWSFSRLDLDTS